MAFFDIFKRKPGGTGLGNTLRGITNRLTGGVLGNGLLMLKEGQTVKENNANALGALGVGLEAIKQATIVPTSPNNSPIQNIQGGVIFQTIKNNLIYILGGLLVVVVLYFTLKKH